MPENVVSAEKLNERLVANPFNAWMGLRIVELTEETIEIGLQWREEMTELFEGPHQSLSVAL